MVSRLTALSLAALALTVLYVPMSCGKSRTTLEETAVQQPAPPPAPEPIYSLDMLADGVNAAMAKEGHISKRDPQGQMQELSQEGQRWQGKLVSGTIIVDDVRTEEARDGRGRTTVMAGHVKVKTPGAEDLLMIIEVPQQYASRVEQMIKGASVCIVCRVQGYPLIYQLVELR